MCIRDSLCHVGWKIYISTVSTPSTNPHIHVTGLPHAAVSVQAGPVAHVRFDITEFGFSGYPVPYLSGNDTIIGMYYHGEGHGYLTGVNATGTRQNVWCMGSATYATN